MRAILVTLGTFMPHRRCATSRKALTFRKTVIDFAAESFGAGMKRGVIYIAGVVGLVYLAALALPRTGRTIEARLQTEMDFALADQGLNDIEAHMDGQTVTFTCRPEMADANRRITAHHMALAIMTAETLTGGLYDESGGYGPVWGPVTRIRADLPAPVISPPAS